MLFGKLQIQFPYLAIIKGAFYGNVVHVGIENCGHLRLLDRADLALGVHDEYADILLATQTVDGGRASVTAGGTNNSQVFSVFALALALVSANEEVLEQVTQELQGDIFESEGRTMEKLQQVEVLLFVEGGDRDDVVGAECTIALLDDFLQVGFGDLGA